MILLAMVAILNIEAAGPDREERSPVIHSGDVPIGGLGHHLGDYLTIEGTPSWPGIVAGQRPFE